MYQTFRIVRRNKKGMKHDSGSQSQHHGIMVENQLNQLGQFSLVDRLPLLMGYCSFHLCHLDK